MIPIFLSFPKPHLAQQQAFIERLMAALRAKGLEPRTLGVNSYDMNAPLKGIRRLLLEANGLICIAFRRSFAKTLEIRRGCNLPNVKPTVAEEVWLTSPYCQIEPAMAFQLGLPILVFRENDVLPEGLLEKGILGLYVPEFDLRLPLDDYFTSPELTELLAQWEGQVRAVRENKGNPPRLY